MVVILNKSSFQLARFMLNFRDAGIKKSKSGTLEALCMAIINSNEEKNIFIILAMISIFQNEEFSL